jgi:hypothetical protein
MHQTHVLQQRSMLLNKFMSLLFAFQVSAHEFAQGLCILNCPDLLNMQTNLALSNLFADKDGQIVLEQFVWAVAKPMFQKLLSPISVKLYEAFVEFLSLPLNGRKDRMSISRNEASTLMSKVMKQGYMNDLHIRCSVISF